MFQTKFVLRFSISFASLTGSYVQKNFRFYVGDLQKLDWFIRGYCSKVYLGDHFSSSFSLERTLMTSTFYFALVCQHRLASLTVSVQVLIIATAKLKWSNFWEADWDMFRKKGAGLKEAATKSIHGETK